MAKVHTKLNFLDFVWDLCYYYANEYFLDLRAYDKIYRQKAGTRRIEAAS